MSEPEAKAPSETDPVMEWQAIQETFVKAEARHSKDLADDQKVKVSKGDKLQARVLSRQNDAITLAKAALNGSPLPDHIRIIQKQHWRWLSRISPAAALPAEAATEPATIDLTPEELPAEPALAESVWPAPALVEDPVGALPAEPSPAQSDWTAPAPVEDRAVAPAAEPAMAEAPAPPEPASAQPAAAWPAPTPMQHPAPEEPAAKPDFISSLKNAWSKFIGG